MLSLVIPVYRSEENLPRLFTELEGFAASVPGQLEVVFVVDGSPDASPFRELLTEFRNLTERYGQALLALGEARGEVAGLRTRVELLEARLDLRLPGPPAWTPEEPAPHTPAPSTEPAATEEPGDVSAEIQAAFAEAPEVAAPAAEADAAEAAAPPVVEPEEPVVAETVVAEPVVAEPVVAEPVAESVEPVVAEPAE
jgi:hypothetical protein